MKIVSMWGISGYQVYWGYKDRSSIVGLMIESVLGNAVIAVASTHCFKKIPFVSRPWLQTLARLVHVFIFSDARALPH